MLQKWLELEIQVRIIEAMNGIGVDKEMQEIYNKFMDLSKAYLQKHKEALFELEDLFNGSLRRGIDLSYRVGFQDGLELGKNTYK